ncbi:hypothetical protein [Microbacterium sorbitolivorans]|uniref:hypothetical protein n=1 Tax=Microbacterium sorbitolivorans TaxID=1867410 RepID=UPI0013B050A8|nr:hypothetical protein [Microbacterium sorbitolivorans]
MTSRPPADGRALHLVALAAGLIAFVVLFLIPGGPLSYLLAAAVGLVAVLIGHRAILRRGPMLWAAIVGLVMSYFELVVAGGLLAVRLMRML